MFDATFFRSQLPKEVEKKGNRVVVPYQNIAQVVVTLAKRSKGMGFRVDPQ